MLICLDFDGVIVDSIDFHIRLAVVAQERLGAGRVPSRHDFEEIDSLSYEGFARRLGIPTDLWKRWETIHMGLVESEGQRSNVFPGIPDILKKLAAENTLCIVTANIEEIVRDTLQRAGFNETIALVLDTYHPGSKADRIREAMKAFGFAADETYMVGDSRSDIKQGNVAGVHTVAVGWGFQNRTILGLENPDHFVDEPAGLLDVFGASL